MAHRISPSAVKALLLGALVLFLAAPGHAQKPPTGPTSSTASKPTTSPAEQVCGALNDRVKDLRRQGKVQEATPLALRAVDLTADRLGKTHPMYASSLMNLGGLYLSMGEDTKAEPLFRQAVEIRRKALGEQDPDYAESLDRLAGVYLSADDFGKAESLYRQALEIRKNALGEQHPDYAIALGNLGSLYSAMREYARAEPLLRQALEIQKEALGEQDRDYAEGLAKLAGLYQSMGDYAKAESLYRQAMEIRKVALGERHQNYAKSLDKLGHLYCKMRDCAKAKPLLLQAMEIRKDVFGEQHPVYADSLYNLGTLYSLLGEYAKAERLDRQALEIMKKAFGEQDPRCAPGLDTLAGLYSDRRDYAMAELLYRQALEIRKKALGEEHPCYADSVTKLAWLYSGMGNYARAEPLFQQALGIRKKVLGEQAPDYADSLSDLGDLYKRRGDYAKAEPLLRQAVDIRRKNALGQQPPGYAESLDMLADLCSLMGDYAKAEPLYQQALEIRKKTLGELHPGYAESLGKLGTLYRLMGDYARAEPLDIKSLEIKKKALGEQHQDYCASLNSLALLYDTTDNPKAEGLFREVLEIKKKVLGEQHPDYAVTLTDLAGMYSSRGDYAKAEPLLRQAWEIVKKTGEQSDKYMYVLRSLAAVYSLMGNQAKAEPLCRQAVEISRRELERAAADESEGQQLAKYANQRDDLFSYLAAALDARTPAQDAYAQTLDWKGAVWLRQQGLRALRRAAADPRLPAHDRQQIAQRYQQLQEATVRLAYLAMAAPPEHQDSAPTSVVDRPGQIAQLSDQIEKLQQELAASSPSLRASRHTLADLQRALPHDAALVDVLDYRDPRPHKAGDPRFEHRLVAFVLRTDQPVQRIELGARQPIQQAVDAWRAGLGATEQDQATSTELRRLVWQPLEKYLKGATTVIVSPDGLLMQFPLGALPGSDPHKYLIEEVALVTVAVPQALVELLQPVAAGGDPSLLLLGDVDYGVQPPAIAATAPAPPDALALAEPPRSSAPRGGWAHWEALGSAASELAAIRTAFEQRWPAGKVQLLRQSAATATAFRQQAPSHRYVHLATHGFFAPQELRSALSDDGVATPRFSGAPLHGVGKLHPGLLSGIVLAGANDPPQSQEDDGILTALEVEEMDLRGVDLAVLSACETGLGQTAGGEGLLGLQRAFQVAGARTVVASLWKVPDDATQELMARFYRNLWQKKLSKVEALRQAQLEMIRGEVRLSNAPDRGLGAPTTVPAQAGGRGRLPPYYWAAFVLSGDWR